MRYLLLSVLVVCVIGVMIPSVIGAPTSLSDFKKFIPDYYNYDAENSRESSTLVYLEATINKGDGKYGVVKFMRYIGNVDPETIWSVFNDFKESKSLHNVRDHLPDLTPTCYEGLPNPTMPEWKRLTCIKDNVMIAVDANDGEHRSTMKQILNKMDDQLYPEQTVIESKSESPPELELVDRWGVKYCNVYAVHQCMAEKQEIGKPVEFRQPYSIVIDSNDFVFVHHYSRADTHDILKISKDGKLVDIWEDISDSMGRMVINSKDEIFVGDVDNRSSFLKLDPNGRISETWNLPSMGFDSADVGEIFIDNQDNLYFSETKIPDTSGVYHEWENTVKKFSPDGTLLKTFENMSAPLAQDSEGNLYGKGKCEIIKYDESGKKLFSFGKCNKPGQIWGTPMHIVVDSNDFVYASYTTSVNPNPVWIFNSEGKLVGNTPYGLSYSKIDARTNLKMPAGLALDSEDTLFVADRMKHSVFKFSEIPIIVQPTEPVVEPEPMIDEEPMASSPTCGEGTVLKNGLCVAEQQTQQSQGGGCLIATAAFGSEMAPQVQFLRELRDNTVLQTESGTSFMTGFNQFYYSFSPAIADYERENPAFKEVVKITLTPLLASLTLLQYADIDSESEMLGYGIGVILLNIGMYFVAPAVLLSVCIRKIHQKQG